uniref:Uncharacterized protein n=1 Tax=Helianthus annuus TaxID=4232 RepID=A0A251V536_HELAN
MQKKRKDGGSSIKLLILISSLRSAGINISSLGFGRMLVMWNVTRPQEFEAVKRDRVFKFKNIMIGCDKSIMVTL